ncbi:MAG: c-type cytochrome [Paracoccaceae bacterium]
MKRTLAILALLSMPALAFAGDAAVGEKEFAKCKSCHGITASDGTAIVKGGKTGPDLFGVIGRQIGAHEGFKYGESIVAAGADGSVWDEEHLVAYVTDPTAWLKEKTGDAGAKSKMTFKLKAKAEDVAAYLATMQ